MIKNSIYFEFQQNSDIFKKFKVIVVLLKFNSQQVFYILSFIWKYISFTLQKINTSKVLNAR